MNILGFVPIENQEAENLIVSSFPREDVFVSNENQELWGIIDSWDCDAVIVSLDGSEAETDFLVSLKHRDRIPAPVIGIYSDASAKQTFDRANAGLIACFPDNIEPAALRTLTRNAIATFKGVSHKDKFGPLEIDYDNRIVTLNDTPVKLTTKQYNIVEYMLQRPDRRLEKDMLWSHVSFGTIDDEPETNGTDVFMVKIKKAFEDALPGSSNAFVTIWGGAISFQPALLEQGDVLEDVIEIVATAPDGDGSVLELGAETQGGKDAMELTG